MTDIMVKLKTCLLVTGAAALISACTPEQTARVIADYAAMRTAADNAATGPTLDVDLTCTTMRIHASGWPTGAVINYSIEDQPGIDKAVVDGARDLDVEIDPAIYPVGYWYVVNGFEIGADAPTLRRDGHVDCTP